MAVRVSEIMNRELFSVGPGEPVGGALGSILALGITGAPVVDEAGKPLGMVSWRDLAGDKPGRTAGERMTQPPATVAAEARIAAAARCLARTGYHRLIVVDEAGRAVGVVSALDVIRGLMGLPAPHPVSFPHLDRETGLTWTDDRALEPGELQAAPDGPGVLVLLHGGAGVPERVIWAESATNVRHRLGEMLATTQPGLLASWLERGGLRFRAAPAPTETERAAAVATVLRRAAATPSSAPCPDR
jgi:CBS domain-containing protein